MSRGLVVLPTGAEGHDPAHLKEAVELTVRDGDDQIEIQLGHFCNNRCVFCVSGQLTEQGLAPKLGTEPVFAALEAAAGRGIRRVTFLGGEPTLQVSFLPSLRKAVALGFDDIVLFTNGVRTHKEPFMDEVLSLGRFTWRFSIQGGDEASHDAVVGRPGAFDRIVRGLRWLSDRDQDITANACVNELSYRSLPKYPALLLDHGVRQLHIDVVRPRSAGVRSDEHYRSILPSQAAMAGPMTEMLELFEARDPLYDVNIGNLPYCALPDHAWRVHHGGQMTATVTTDDRGRLGRVWDKYRWQATGMVYADACEGCAFRDACRGVPDKYAEIHGLGELTALGPELRERTDRRRAALRRDQERRASRADADRDRRRLARVVETARRLRDIRTFEGWTWDGHASLGNQAGVAVSFVGPRQERFELRLTPGSAEFVPVGATTAQEARPGIEAVASALS